ncbi:GDSL-type esterase/lipase family protein [Bacteroides sedimenti]|uniref:Sialate O-acetylesterase n=1 Tax=Bacteroides sedimenti TaxID=2136147 RepID=A0ABN6Z6G4_9BACE
MKKNCLLILLCLLFGTNSFAQKGKYGTFYDQRTTLFENLPIRSTDIVFLGNSLTNGCEWAELFGNPRIKNRGISGDEVMGIYDRINPILRGKPAKIFLLTGVNDVSHDLSADSILVMYTKLVDKIRKDSPRTKLYIQSLLPVNDEFTRFPKVHNKTQIIIDINKGLKALAKEKKCTYIDLYPHFLAPGTQSLEKKYTNDGLHLLGAGYLKWKEIIRPFVD